jgi:hypothetical protein
MQNRYSGTTKFFGGMNSGGEFLSQRNRENTQNRREL